MQSSYKMCQLDDGKVHVYKMNLHNYRTYLRNTLELGLGLKAQVCDFSSKLTLVESLIEADRKLISEDTREHLGCLTESRELVDKSWQQSKN